MYYIHITNKNGQTIGGHARTFFGAKQNLCAERRHFKESCGEAESVKIYKATKNAPKLAVKVQ